MNPPRLENQEDVQAWIITHHAECGTRVEQQRAINADVELRLRRLESRVLVLAALGAAAGGGISKLLF